MAVLLIFNALLIGFGVVVISPYDAAAINLNVGESAQDLRTFLEMIWKLHAKEFNDFEADTKTNDKITYTHAVCDFVNNIDLDDDTAAKNNIVGRAVLQEEVSGNGPLIVSIKLEGIDPNSPEEHGLHVHEFGDLSDGCTSTGSHFNPEGMNHGAPDATVRHVGDWGNVVRDNKGRVEATFEDNLATLASGDHNIIGRGLVLHALTDDLGLGGNKESLKTGNAGPRLACCTIAVAADPKNE